MGRLDFMMCFPETDTKHLTNLVLFNLGLYSKLWQLGFWTSIIIYSWYSFFALRLKIEVTVEKNVAHNLWYDP